MSKQFGRGLFCGECGSGPHKPEQKFFARRRKFGKVLCDRCFKRMGKKNQGDNRKSSFK